MFERKVRFVCPACGHKTKLSLAFVRAHEAEFCARPGEPPEIECHWCHQGLMVPMKYRFSTAHTFRLPRQVRRQLRSNQNTL
jgi:redox-regulated HSP33 family molecular chaperone